MVGLDAASDFACLAHESGDLKLDLDEVYYTPGPAAVVTIPN
jgi:hypothetical protein